MNKSGLIIRLIDIALIILFGFIAISDIKVKAQIKLPVPVQGESRQSRNLFVTVRLLEAGGYAVKTPEGTTNMATAPELERFLQQKKALFAARQKVLCVLIEPEKETIVQKTIDVLDMCAKLRIPKNLAFDYADLNL